MEILSYWKNNYLGDPRGVVLVPAAVIAVIINNRY